MSTQKAQLRGWRSVLVVLPIPLILVAGWGMVHLRSERICAEQTRTSALAPTRLDYGSTKGALLGDSWAVGDGQNPAYPQLVAQALNLDMRVSAVGGTGYVNDGACGNESFATRVSIIPRDARLVIVAGGLNDTGEDPDAVADAVDRLIARVHHVSPRAVVAVVGVPSVPLLESSATSRVDAILRSSSTDVFIDVSDARISVSADEVHPTAEGQLQYADRLIAELSNEQPGARKDRAHGDADPPEVALLPAVPNQRLSRRPMHRRR